MQRRRLLEFVPIQRLPHLSLSLRTPSVSQVTRLLLQYAGSCVIRGFRNDVYAMWTVLRYYAS